MSRPLEGAARAIRGFLFALAVTAAGCAAALAAVWPLWYLAVHHTRAYNLLLAGVAGAAATYAAFRAIARRSRRPRRPASFPREGPGRPSDPPAGPGTAGAAE